MRGILEPMFGEWGAQIVQFLVTAAIVIVLVAIAYWLVRRYSLGGHGRVGRGRVPRLSIVDAMPVDARRRLVLVRRDNVEHLILVGGPSDVVVEQSIQRPRRPKPGDAPGDLTASAEPVAAAPPAESALILFPSARAESVHPHAAPVPPPPAVHAAPYNGSTGGSGNGASGNGVHQADKPFTFRRATAVPPAAVRQPMAAEFPAQPPSSSPARYVDIQRPTRIESAAIAAPIPAPVEPEPMLPDLPTADLPPEPDVPATNGAGAYARVEPDEARAAPREPSPFAKPRAMEEDTAAKVSDLEREMARLLGEITQNRSP